MTEATASTNGGRGQPCDLRVAAGSRRGPDSQRRPLLRQRLTLLWETDLCRSTNHAGRGSCRVWITLNKLLYAPLR